MRRLLDRFRLISGLRLLSALSLVLLAGSVFWQPIHRVLRPKVAPTLQHLAVPEILRPKSKGFIVRVVSEPAAATVSIDGTPRGSTPLFANVSCAQDQEVRITVEKQGYSPSHHTVRCQVDGEHIMKVRLGN